jgi:hypothetical protein
MRSGAKRTTPVWCMAVLWAAALLPHALAGQAGVGALQNARDSAALVALTPEPLPAEMRTPLSATAFTQIPVVEVATQAILVNNKAVALCVYVLLQDSTTVSIPLVDGVPPHDSPVLQPAVLEWQRCHAAYATWLEQRRPGRPPTKRKP